MTLRYKFEVVSNKVNVTDDNVLGMEDDFV